MASCYSDRDLSLVPDISFTFVEDYIKMKKQSSRNKSLNKGYKYFSEGYISDLTVSPSESGCKLVGKCYRSQRKSEIPYQIQAEKETIDGSIDIKNVTCGCAIQLSACCGHISGLLYHFIGKL